MSLAGNGEPIEEKRDAGVKHGVAKRPFLLLLSVFPQLHVKKAVRKAYFVHEIAALSIETQLLADRNALQQRRQERLRSTFPSMRPSTKTKRSAL